MLILQIIVLANLAVGVVSVGMAVRSNSAIAAMIAAFTLSIFVVLAVKVVISHDLDALSSQLQAAQTPVN